MSVNIVFYGPEGSGKGTQAKMVAEKFNIPHLISGDLVRKYAKEDNGIMGRICKDALHKGHYVADSEMYVLWKQRFKEGDTKSGWVLDGFPRNLTQAKFLERKIEKYGQRLDAVVYLDVSEAETMKRLSKRARKNPDGSLHDSQERIVQRLKHFNRGRKAVIRYYKKRNILIKVNGLGSESQVLNTIMKKINSIIKIKKEMNDKKNGKA